MKKRLFIGLIFLALLVLAALGTIPDGNAIGLRGA